jgi:hypothetical protein
MSFLCAQSETVLELVRTKTQTIGLLHAIHETGSLKGSVLLFVGSQGQVTTICKVFDSRTEYEKDRMRWELASQRTNDTSYCSKDEFGTILSYPEHLLTKIL